MKRLYYPETTYQQRRHAFELWQLTGKIKSSCESARISPRTFRNWRKRFEDGGFEALENPLSHAPHNCPHRLSNEVRAKIIAMKKENPSWGKKRISDQLRKENNWESVASHMAVQRVLQEEGLMPLSVEKGKSSKKKCE